MKTFLIIALFSIPTMAHAGDDAAWFIGGAIVGNLFATRQPNVIVVPQQPPQVVYQSEQILISPAPNGYSTPYSQNGYGYPPVYYPPRPIYHCNSYGQCQLIGWR